MAVKAGRGSEQFMLRLPEGMRDRIREAAQANGRSMNAEIVASLEDWLTPYREGPLLLRVPRILAETIRKHAVAQGRGIRDIADMAIIALWQAFPEPSFDLGTLITQLGTSLAGAKTLSEAERLVSEANQELEASLSEWRVRVTTVGARHNVTIVHVNENA